MPTSHSAKINKQLLTFSLPNKRTTMTNNQHKLCNPRNNNSNNSRSSPNNLQKKLNLRRKNPKNNLKRKNKNPKRSRKEKWRKRCQRSSLKMVTKKRLIKRTMISPIVCLIECLCINIRF